MIISLRPCYCSSGAGGSSIRSIIAHGLPLSDGLHIQLQQHHVDRILRRLVYHHDTAHLEKNRTKMLPIFSGLEIGHRDYMGKQIVYCKPFRDIHLDKGNDAGRMDCVFFIPPPPYYTGSRRDFDLSLENAWYGRVSLLCSMKFRTDSGEDISATIYRFAMSQRTDLITIGIR